MFHIRHTTRSDHYHPTFYASQPIRETGCSMFAGCPCVRACVTRQCRLRLRQSARAQRTQRFLLITTAQHSSLPHFPPSSISSPLSFPLPPPPFPLLSPSPNSSQEVWGSAVSSHSSWNYTNRTGTAHFVLCLRQTLFQHCSTICLEFSPCLRSEL